MPKSGLFLQKPKVYQNVYLNLIYIIKNPEPIEYNFKLII